MWEYNYNPYYLPETVPIEHHGVKGMKWGVRRYQNKDGSYTKRGLERYRKAEADYDSAKEKQKSTKQAYKKGTASRSDVKAANRNVKAKKQQMSKAYDRLKTDKLADEGKELYRRGKTITGNTTRNAIAQITIVAGSRVINQMIASKTGDQRVANLATAAISAGGTAVNALLAGNAYRRNKRLRAYYAH